MTNSKSMDNRQIFFIYLFIFKKLLYPIYIYHQLNDAYEIFKFY